MLLCAAGVVPDSARGDLLEEVANLVGAGQSGYCNSESTGSRAGLPSCGLAPVVLQRSRMLRHVHRHTTPV